MRNDRRIWGFEVNASASPFEDLRIDVAYSYLNSLLQQFNGAAYDAQAAAAGPSIIPTTTQGYELPETPKNKATITATYTLPIPENYGNLSVAGTYVYEDKMITTAPSLDPTPYAGPMRLLNFSINWISIFGSQINGSLFMTTALNEKDVTFIEGLYGLGFDA